MVASALVYVLDNFDILPLAFDRFDPADLSREYFPSAQSWQVGYSEVKLK